MTIAMLWPRGTARVRVLSALVLGLSACGRVTPAGDGDAQARAAAQTFTSICARCHGSDGKGGIAPDDDGKTNAPRNFCDAAFQASRTDDQLKEAIRQGKGAMPAFGNAFSDAELQGLVLKIRSFNPGLKSH